MPELTFERCDCCGRNLAPFVHEWVSLEVEMEKQWMTPGTDISDISGVVETIENPIVRRTERINLCSACCSDRLHGLLTRLILISRDKLVNYLKRGVELKDGIHLKVLEKKRRKEKKKMMIFKEER